MSVTAGFDSSWEKNIYSRGKQLNRYPFSDVVSQVMRLFGDRLTSGETLRALEVGCGSGNNVIFLARAGFETYGIEGSRSACEFAVELLEAEGLDAELTVGDLVRLPYEDDFFDFVLDREAIYCNVPSAISRAIEEIHRVLRPGGLFLTFMFSVEHGGRLSKGGRLIDANTYTGFESGAFEGAGVTHLFSEDEIRDHYLKEFEIEFIRHQRLDNIAPSGGNVYAEFQTCARKK